MRNPILGPTCEMPGELQNLQTQGLLAEALNLLIQDNDPARQQKQDCFSGENEGAQKLLLTRSSHAQGLDERLSANAM